ncbi:rhamnogalacturonan endolyase [Gracilibacillus halotolerans]|uniref:Rhamnogalacturonan endolyase n=1 Tax=Gracilibacillus halotolerans TaxID=74386 RepID=A0A841RLG7_9BACI|nr:rhamnogalacturonan lyase [Gracilibacillus halotolerans]MBB6512463.1 rhamnogalacturonan endolyase [Gracilibacillus halotolerans]
MGNRTRKNIKTSLTYIMLTGLILSVFTFPSISVANTSNEWKTLYETDFGDEIPTEDEMWGFSTFAAELSINNEQIGSNSSNKLQFSVEDQSGGRVATKELKSQVSGEQIHLSFDWYPGKSNDKGSHLHENGGEFRIGDASSNTIFTINSTNEEPISYYVGQSERQDTSFTDQETWYHTEITFNLVENNVQFSMKDTESGEEETHTASLDDIAFDGTISVIRLAGIRTSGNNHTWTTYLDNVAISHLPVSENAIANIPSLPYHRLYVGDAVDTVESIGLPDSVPVILANHEKVDVPVQEWIVEGKDWNPKEQGVYTFRGILAEVDGLENPFHHTATQYVYNRLTPPETNRDTEWLDRGVVAIHTEEGNFISWRLLVDEYSEDISFNIYSNGNKLNSNPLSVTNFTDESGKVNQTYTVETLLNDKSIQEEDVTVGEKDYLSVPLQKPEGGTTPTGDYTYSANDASVGDLDGDGEYEIILKWRPSNAMMALEDVITGPTIFDAYKLDGTLMWRINMGMNLTSGPQYHQFVVADMDSDGKSEFLIKTGDGTRVYGTTDGVYDESKVISVVGNMEDDGKWIDEGGHQVTGPEYVSVFDGETGEVIDTIDFAFPVEKVEGDQGASWGDTFYNRSDRFLSGVAYLDGKKPSAIYGRGYYVRTGFVAYSLENGELIEEWVFDTDDHNGYGEGLGNHNLATGDVDNDGYDEIIAGSLTLDHDGTILYAMDGAMGRVKGSHGDALHVGAFDPEREGLHVFGVREDSEVASLEYHDGATGETIKAFYAYKDAGRGVAANITPKPGYEYWGAGGTTTETGGGVYNVQGGVEAEDFRNINLPVNFVTYWDGDLLHELLDGTTITKYKDADKSTYMMESFEEVMSINGTKANPSLQVDILGDWREEVIYPTEDSSELRIFTTSIPTEYRLPTLMHDTVYRMGIAWQNTTYNQPPHIGYYLGEDIREEVLAGELSFPKVNYTPSLQAIKHVVLLQGGKNVLMNKLDQAEHQYQKGNTHVAIKQLEGFIKQLKKSNFDDQIIEELINSAQQVINSWK